MHVCHPCAQSLLTCWAGLAVRLAGGTSPGAKGALGTRVLRAEVGPWQTEVPSRAQLRSSCSRAWDTREEPCSGGIVPGDGIVCQQHQPPSLVSPARHRAQGKQIPRGRRMPVDSSGLWQVMSSRSLQTTILQKGFCPDQRQWKPKIMVSSIIHHYQASGKYQFSVVQPETENTSSHR